MRTCCVQTRHTRQHVFNAAHEPEHTLTQYTYVLSLCVALAVAVLSISDTALAVAGCSLGAQHGCSPRRLYPSQRHLRNPFRPFSGGHRRTAAVMQRHKHAAARRRGANRHAHPRSRPARAPCWLCAISSVMVFVEHHSRNHRGSRRETAMAVASKLRTIERWQAPAHGSEKARETGVGAAALVAC